MKNYFPLNAVNFQVNNIKKSAKILYH